MAFIIIILDKKLNIIKIKAKYILYAFFINLFMIEVFWIGYMFRDLEKEITGENSP